MEADLRRERDIMTRLGYISGNFLMKYIGFRNDCMPWSEGSSGIEEQSRFDRMMGEHDELMRASVANQQQEAYAV